MKPFQAPVLVLFAALSAGCSASLDYSRVQSLSCPDIDVAVGETAKDISRAAIRRGNIRNYDVPFWVLGADRAKEALVDRDTQRIEDLRTAQTGLIAERNRRCG